MIDLPDKPGVYEDQRGRAFALHKGHWFFLVLGRRVHWEDDLGVEELVPLAPISGNVEADFKPFRARERPTDIEEAPDGA